MPSIPVRDAVTVITGASEGIGREAALEFSRAGARVILAARNTSRLDELASTIRAEGGEALAVTTDVTRDGDVTALAGAALSRFGRIDILIANAGVGLWGPVESLPMAALREVFEVNYFGVVRCVRAVVPAMKSRRSGRVQIVSSVIGLRSMPGYSGYCASKFALQALAESLRVELADSGVGVQMVYPALTATAFSANAIRRDPGGAPPRLRPMPPQEVARHMLRAARRGSRDHIITAGGRLLVALNGLAPRLVDRILARVMNRVDAAGPAGPSEGEPRDTPTTGDPDALSDRRQ